MSTETKKTLEEVAAILNKAGWSDNRIHIGGDVVNSQVGQVLTNCTNMVQQQAPGERRDLLEKLNREGRELIDQLPADQKGVAAENLEMLVKQATHPKPNRKWYSLSAEGLLEAAKWAKDFTGNIVDTVKTLGKSLWPDFSLSESK